MVKRLRSTYTPTTLPAHVINPSLIGFGVSLAPPIDQEFVILDNAYIIDKLMRGLGFGCGLYRSGG